MFFLVAGIAHLYHLHFSTSTFLSCQKDIGKSANLLCLILGHFYT